MALQAKALVKLTGILIILWLSALNVAMAEVGAGDSGSTGSFDINERSVTITQAGTYTITGGEIETKNTIEVNIGDGGTANITIEGVKITASDCPFYIKRGTVNLTLVGDGNVLQAGQGFAALQVSEYSKLVITGDEKGKLTATGGNNGAGIGGGYGSAGTITIAGGTVTATGGNYGAGIGGCYGSAGSIIIAGGTVVATGGDSGAGIGGSSNSNYGSITISGGTVVATGGDQGAGIGGGFGSSDVSITISGGMVTAIGGNSGAGIGGGYNGSAGTITIAGGKVTTKGNIGDGEGGRNATGTISGGTIVCKSISPSLSIEGGSVRTEDNTVMSNGKVMAVVKGSPNELPANTKVTSIKIGGVKYEWTDVYTDENGMLYLYLQQEQFGSVSLVIGEQAYTVNTLREYNVFNERVEIKAAGDYIITGNSEVTNHTITVELPKTNDVANITIKGVKITTGMSICPFNIIQGVVHLTLEDDDNELEAGDLCAALQVPWSSELLITKKSTGKLTATGGNFGAGIGGSMNNPIGSITILGGTVVATGGGAAAGIGGGYGGPVGSITISGGTVTATGGSDAAGIGGGFQNSGGSITISGGKITTTGNIGDGEGSISPAKGEISGGTIVCKSISPTLSITGGSVRTKGNSFVGDKGMAVVKGLPKGEKVTSIKINDAPYGSNDVYTDDKGQLYLYITKGGAVPVSITIDDKVYTLHVTLEPIITISGKEVTYNESDHKDKSILIGNNVTFTIDAPDASVIDLTIEKGGKLLTEQQLEVKGRFTVDLKANEQKWITFCSPVPLKLLYPNWATGAGDTNCLFLKSGFTTANDQKWTFEQSIKEDTPYLIGVPTGVAAYTLYAQNVKLPGRKEDISINPPSDFDNNLLFRANTSLTEQKLKDIYVLDVSSQKLVLKTEDYILKPFEAYFVASPATRNMFKTISLLGSDGQPTGIAEVKVQKNTNFKAYSNSPGTLTFENQGEPAAVIVVNALGKGMFVYSNFTGSKHLYGLSAGVYFVRSNKEVKKVIVK